MSVTAPVGQGGLQAEWQPCLTKVKFRRRAKVEALFTFTVAAYNIVRIPELMAPISISTILSQLACLGV